MWLKALPFLGVFAAVAIVAVVFRARSIKRNAGTDGIEIPSGTFLRYVWLELKNLFKFSRY